MAILGKRRRKEEPTDRILDVNASMQGSLTFQEPVNLRISGRFEGTLETQGDLTIGEQAQVSADVTGETITIAGRVTGKVIAKRRLTLIPPAFVQGEISTPILRVEEGASLEGTVHMQERPSWMTSEEVAEYLEVELRLVEEWAREGKIPADQEGGTWRFAKAKIDEWVSAQKNS
jgi:excisionase family DNA binding protein